MKRISSVIFFLLFTIVAFSADINKEFNKMIAKYDVSDSAKVVPQNNPKRFWQAMLYHNEACIKFLRDIKKNRGAEREALQKLSEMPRFYPQYDESIIEGLQGFCDSMLIDMGITELPIPCSLHIVHSDEVNAFMALTEDDAFAICLTSALVLRKGMNREIIMGIIAHEFAHGALKHQIRGLYAGAKERRKNELTAGIAAGINALAAGANAFVAGMNGQCYDNTAYYIAEIQLNEQKKTSTLKYIYDYTKGQEFEADLIAFRFLENKLGSGEEYINALRILGSVYNHLSPENKDMIPTSTRINFLKYVNQNPELGNKINTELRRERVKKVYAPAQF